ncbi:MAG TPA: hypothetical protein VK425_08860 [Acidimicrobiales bacterium]|nr:hypothetical protein [Acidimicrobiales bacterium]
MVAVSGQLVSPDVVDPAYAYHAGGREAVVEVVELETVVVEVVVVVLGGTVDVDAPGEGPPPPTITGGAVVVVVDVAAVVVVLAETVVVVNEVLCWRGGAASTKPKLVADAILPL